MRHHTANPAQLGFDSWLAQADEDNDRFRFLTSVEHLPGKWDEALPYYRALIDQHHAAMLEADGEEVFRLKDEAHDLAVKLNGGTSLGICAPDGYGRRLEEAAASTSDELPKWGQAGSFTMDHDGMAVRIEIDGLFGIAVRSTSGRASKPMLSIAASRSSATPGFGALQGVATQA